jgi:hypothetical protein
MFLKRFRPSDVCLRSVPPSVFFAVILPALKLAQPVTNDPSDPKCTRLICSSSNYPISLVSPNSFLPSIPELSKRQNGEKQIMYKFHQQVQQRNGERRVSAEGLIRLTRNKSTRGTVPNLMNMYMDGQKATARVIEATIKWCKTLDAIFSTYIPISMAVRKQKHSECIQDDCLAAMVKKTSRRDHMKFSAKRSLLENGQTRCGLGCRTAEDSNFRR